MRTKLIQHARKTVSTLYRMGCGYVFRRYDPTFNAWRESIPMDYHKALAARAQALIDIAREAADKDPVQYDGGNWTNYVKLP